MDVVQLADPAEFLERATPLLLEDEARHNLILGLAGSLRSNPTLYDEHHFWLVEDDGAVVAAALRTPPYNLVLGAGDAPALTALAGAIEQELPGVVGSVPEVETFASTWTQRHGTKARVEIRQGIYALDAVAAPAALPEGNPRAATVHDRPLLVEWWGAFAREALGALEQDEELNGRSIDHRLAAAGGGIALWDVGAEPVSLVGFGSPTPTGVRIGPVYTPPEHRGRGYASALTAHVSQEQLDAGRRFCFLYTDLANPTSNKIYLAIGYRRVCDSAQYAFV